MKYIEKDFTDSKVLEYEEELINNKLDKNNLISPQIHPTLKGTDVYDQVKSFKHFNDLKDQMFQDQGGICCYCGQALKYPNHPPYIVEHVTPKETCRELAGEYENLLLSCRPTDKEEEERTTNHGKPKKYWHCDKLKANKTLKKVIDNNYVIKKNYRVFNNPNITFEDAMLIAKKLLFRRGNVVWIDFGFNIGNEFGGMHPAVILKNFEKDLFVLPISSKKPIEYVRIEKDFEDGKISQEECKQRKDKITEIVQLDNIVGFKEMTRWANITRIRKVSLLRLNFSGTIGTLDGTDMDKIAEKISIEFGNKNI